MFPLLNPRLIPFWASVILYYILYQPYLDYPPVTLGAAFFKALPVWALTGYVIMTSRKPNQSSVLPNERYPRYMTFGLLVSSVGAACLIARKTLFIPGVLAYSVAQGIFVIALRPPAEGSRTKWHFVFGGAGTFLFLEGGIDGYFMKFIILLYTLLIFTMGWLATARYEVKPSFSTLAGCVGASLFILSDIIIAADKWRFSIPFAPGMIITTYYGAHIGLALSTV